MKLTAAQNRWHRFAYRAARPLVRAISHCLIGFRSDKYIPRHKTFLLMSNHYTDMDMLVVVNSLRAHSYFVASAHISHWGWIGRLITFLQRPIWRAKGHTDAQCAMEILRVLKAGYPVTIFIEGERSWGGRTMPIADSAGRLARMSGVALITYRLSDAYLVWPRWSKKKRRGRLYGRVIHEYAPEELAAMTNQQVQELIERDLHCDFYEDQRRAPRAYPGEQMAESLETALYLCPACGESGRLHSRGDLFFCDCGLRLRLDEYGCFAAAEGGEPPFATIQQWFDWQQRQLPAYIERRPGVLAGERRGQSLYRVNGAQLDALGVGAMSLDRAGLHFALIPQRVQKQARQGADNDLQGSVHNKVRDRSGSLAATQYGDVYGRAGAREYENSQIPSGSLAATQYGDVYGRAGAREFHFALDEITGMAAISQMLLTFSAGGEQYEARSDHPRSAIKYVHLYQALKGK
ncbi:MAG: lysophospholipid acyltransferase family protein [Bacillota bacterium]|nr:lysophospholipid acyltransferase family protein [Bacillota bacterium]